ncbi:translation initiation factor eIF-1A [Haloferax namakaokahaiae]|uniref:Translation initiation factor 1A n=1 Tax=Haloferax namakaokahaiae TaxID=1748331 RepID=A0ABD5ZFB1_9EURY
MTSESGQPTIRLPTGTEVFAVVSELSGFGGVRLECSDGKDRVGRIPGTMRRRSWVTEGDLVLADPWSWEDNRADVTWRYDDASALHLRTKGVVAI